MNASFTFLLTHSLAWALLYSLWQGLIVYGVLFILLRVLRNARANIRYHLSTGAFAALFVWFASTWAEQYQRIKGITVYITQGSSTVALPASHHTAATINIPEANYSVLKQAVMSLEHYSSWIIALYSIGLAIMLTRFALSLWQVRILKQTSIAGPHDHLNELMEYWQDQFGISRRVKLLLSSRIDVPMMLGIIKPIILLPVASVNNLSIDQLEAILMHELAHIKRNDYLLNILQTIAETILFFNPFVWLISREIGKEREHCCDDMVVEHASDPLPYAKALAILETSRYEGGLTLAATGNKDQLLNRIKRIMEMKKQHINYGQAGIIIVAIAAIICSVAVFSPTFAQKKKHKEEKTERIEKSEPGGSTTTTTNTKTVTKVKVITVDSNGNKKVVNETIDNNGDNDIALSYKDDDFSIDMDGAMRSIAEASKEIAEALSNVDKKQMERDMEDARREIAKARKEMASVDWDEVRDAINKGLAEADKQLNDPKLREQIDYEVRQGLEEGKRALAEAKRELHKSISISVNSDDKDHIVSANGDNFDEMLDMMEEDGLINRKKGFAIAKSPDELRINNKLQPESVFNKYKRYMKARNVAISGAKGSLNVAIDD